LSIFCVKKFFRAKHWVRVEGEKARGGGWFSAENFSVLSCIGRSIELVDRPMHLKLRNPVFGQIWLIFAAAPYKKSFDVSSFRSLHQKTTVYS